MPSKVAYFTAQLKIFSTANQPKSHLLFHENGSPWDSYMYNDFGPESCDSILKQQQRIKILKKKLLYQVS